MTSAHVLTPRMKWVGLGGLVAAWLVLLYVNVIAVPSPQEVPLRYKSGQSPPTARQAERADMWEVRSLRAPARELPGTPKKNIFSATAVTRSLTPQATAVARHTKQHALATSPALAPTAPEVPPTPPSPSPEEVARQQEALREQQLREQMAQYRYLGYANQNGVQKAFLSKGREIYILSEGETLEGKFQVVLIEANVVKLLDVDSKLETILKLKKEESSAAGV